MFVLSLLGATVPMLIYLLLWWKFDKNAHESVKLVLAHFVLGATVAIVLGIIGSKILSFPLFYLLSKEQAGLLTKVFIAPFVEELSKASILFYTINNKNIDNLTDGLIYGGAVGLGFGTTENFIYFFLFGSTLKTFALIFILRTGFSAVMHALATATLGGTMAIKKYSSKFEFILFTILALLIAMLIHLGWNLCISFTDTQLLGIIFIVFVVVVFIITYSFSLKYERKIITNNLKQEIPEEYIKGIVFRENLPIKKNVKKDFIKTAILLAFKKHQVGISMNNKDHYKNEVYKLRIKISELIKENKQFYN
jgi:RsiW-degrading membrane proteinase PrsW (M82 family)